MRQERTEMKFRHAKIVCTLGPACSSSSQIEAMMRAGMNVARLNFSHGTDEAHAATITQLRQASGRLQMPISLVADLQGPKIRTGKLVGGIPVVLKTGQRFTISIDGTPGTSAGVSTNFTRLPREVRKGDRILFADGLIELRVKSTGRTQVVCEVSNGGTLGEHKGINLPGVPLRVPSLTPKDHEDLRFAVRHTANYIAVSFVRSAKDVRQVHAARGAGGIEHAGDREARKAGGDRGSRRDSRRCRRGDGGARRSGRRDEPGARARGAEADHRARPGSPRPGDHRDADARIHDGKSAGPRARRRPTWPTRSSTAATP